MPVSQMFFSLLLSVLAAAVVTVLAVSLILYLNYRWRQESSRFDVDEGQSYGGDYRE